MRARPDLRAGGQMGTEPSILVCVALNSHVQSLFNSVSCVDNVGHQQTSMFCIFGEFPKAQSWARTS